MQSQFASGLSPGSREWRPVADFPAYEVSDDGFVRRVDGKYTGGKPLAVQFVNGYSLIRLWKDNIEYGKLVHVLVAQAFIGPCPPGKEVNHVDGNKLNNTQGNLEYLTRVENIAHARKLGLMKLDGVDNPMSVLNEQQVLEILAVYTPGQRPGYKALAKQYAVGWECIRDIVKHKSWRYLHARAS